MHPTRRMLLLTVPALALAPVSGTTPALADDDPRLAPRFVGSATAPVSVTEWFSLTCPHCARFARDTLPQIRKELIEPGKLQYGYGDFPLDQVALTAAMVARSLPPERYEPFILALLSSQDRWAFARGINNTDEIFKMAALAGMSRTTFDTVIADTKLRDAILAAQDNAQKVLKVNSTPTFLFHANTTTAAKPAEPPAAIAPPAAEAPPPEPDQGVLVRLEHRVLSWFGLDSPAPATATAPTPAPAPTPPTASAGGTGDRQASGEMSFDAFAQVVKEVAGAGG